MARERISRPRSKQSAPANDSRTSADESAQLHFIDGLRSELRSQPVASHRAFQQRLIQKTLHVLQTSPSPTLVINCVALYFELLSASASSFDHLCFDICLVNISHVLKSTHLRACPVSDKTLFEAIWKRLITLIQSNSFNLSDHAVVHLIVSAFANVLQYGDSSVIQKAMAGIHCLLHSSSAGLFVVNIVYKAILPLVSLHLPVPNRKALTKVIITVADRESEWLASEQNETMQSSPPQQPHASELPRPILRFLQVICVRAPEKAESRNDVAQLIVQVLLTREATYIQRYQRFLFKACCHARLPVRLLSLQTLSCLNAQSEEGRQPMEELVRVLLALCSRVDDRVANVRAKALASILEVFRSLAAHRCKTALENVGSRVLEAVASRIRDDKSRVRRNALDLLGFLCIQHITVVDDVRPMDTEEGNRSAARNVEMRQEQLDMVQVCESIKQRCSDASSVVRQSAMKHITEVVLKVESSGLQKYLRAILRLWIEAVLPRMNDTDARCQEICLNNVNEVFLKGLGAERAAVDGGVSEKHLANVLLQEIGEREGQLVELVRKALIILCKKEVIGVCQLQYICGVLKSEDATVDERIRAGSWVVAEAISCSGKGEEVVRLVGQRNVVDAIVSKHKATACLAAANLVHVMDSGTKRVLQAHCTKVLFPGQSFRELWKDNEFISAVGKLLGALSNEVGDELLAQCEGFIAENGSDLDEKTSVGLLHIIGCACVHFRLRTPPPSGVVTFVEAMTSNVQTSSAQRAVAITTLGKLCLVEGFEQCAAPREMEERRDSKSARCKLLGESLTRRVVSVFVHELDNATSSATRNNAVVVLCDLCRHYTAIVEPFMPRVAALLSDASEFVRVQAISSLVDLLQQDYIKMRTGPLLYRMATALVDSCSTVCCIAEYAVLQVMRSKNASLLGVCFVELIFVLNECTESSTYNRFGSGGGHAAALRVEDEWRRRTIYDVFLKGMGLEQRLRLRGRLRSDIIGSVLDAKVDFSQRSVQAVVEDALSVLAAPALNPFGAMRSACDGAVEEGCDEEGHKGQGGGWRHGERVETKKTALLRKVDECELREALVPCLVELRWFLEKRRSPTIKKVMQCLCAVLRAHGESLSTMIEDAVVRAEVQRDMQAGDGK